MKNFIKILLIIIVTIHIFHNKAFSQSKLDNVKYLLESVLIKNIDNQLLYKYKYTYLPNSLSIIFANEKNDGAIELEGVINTKRFEENTPITNKNIRIWAIIRPILDGLEVTNFCMKVLYYDPKFPNGIFSDTWTTVIGRSYPPDNIN